MNIGFKILLKMHIEDDNGTSWEDNRYFKRVKSYFINSGYELKVVLRIKKEGKSDELIEGINIYLKIERDGGMTELDGGSGANVSHGDENEIVLNLTKIIKGYDKDKIYGYKDLFEKYIEKYIGAGSLSEGFRKLLMEIIGCIIGYFSRDGQMKDLVRSDVIKLVLSSPNNSRYFHKMSGFQQRVYLTLSEIYKEGNNFPKDEKRMERSSPPLVLSYKELGQIMGVKSYRSIGMALSKNRFPIIIPCHRIISERDIGGYMGSSFKNWIAEMREYGKNGGVLLGQGEEGRIIANTLRAPQGIVVSNFSNFKKIEKINFSKIFNLIYNNKNQGEIKLLARKKDRNKSRNGVWREILTELLYLLIDGNNNQGDINLFETLPEGLRIKLILLFYEAFKEISVR
ncbi:MAG: MGMT family protein [Promethearchaeota archaeon]